MNSPSSAFVLQSILPRDVVDVIDSFIPRPVKKKKEQISPSMQKELHKLQTITLKGKNGMYMRDFEEFCLD
jgi:hypothetical protein